MDIETVMERLLAKLDADREDRKAWQEEMAAITGEWGKDSRKETLACQEMEARQEEEPISLDRNPEAAEQRDVPAEDAEVMPVGETKEKVSGQKAGCRAPPPESEEFVAGISWTPEEIGCHPEMDESPCNISMAKEGNPQEVLDPGRLCTPDEVGCHLQEDIPSRDSGTMLEKCLQEGNSPGSLRMPAERSDRHRNKNYTLCRTQAYGAKQE